MLIYESPQNITDLNKKLDEFKKSNSNYSIYAFFEKMEIQYSCMGSFDDIRNLKGNIIFSRYSGKFEDPEQCIISGCYIHFDGNNFIVVVVDQELLDSEIVNQELPDIKTYENN